MRLLHAAAILLLSAVSTGASERTVDAGGFPATIAGAEAAGPLVVMIAGSGPTDRDGNSPLGVSASYLRKLATGLAKSGVASLRYDKRGAQGSVEPGPESGLDFDSFVDDLFSVVTWAREAFPGREIVLLGHSEGGLVALAAVTRDAGAFSGLVLIATPGRAPGDTIRDQLPALPEPPRSEAQAILSELEAGRPVADVPTALVGLFRPSVQPFLISLLALRPAAMLGSLELPVLLVGGGTDIQVRRSDFEALTAARPDADSRWFSRMKHVLTDAPPDFAGNVATYADPDAPLTAGLVEAVADFVRRLRP